MTVIVIMTITTGRTLTKWRLNKLDLPPSLSPPLLALVIPSLVFVVIIIIKTYIITTILIIVTMIIRSLWHLPFGPL